MTETGNIDAYVREAGEGLQLAQEAIASPLLQAAADLTQVLLNDGRILCCAAGPDRALAHFVADRLMVGVDLERPALPALALTATSAAAAADLWQSARALARDPDLLLCIDSSAGAAILRGAIDTADAGNLRLVGLSHTAVADIDSEGRFVIMAVPATERRQIQLLHTFTLDCLCRLVDANLFGE